jgi:hypothetical protein
MRALRTSSTRMAAASCSSARSASARGEPNGLPRQEHGHLLALLDRRAADEEGDGDALGVLESRREVDDDLAVADQRSYASAAIR